MHTLAFVYPLDAFMINVVGTEAVRSVIFNVKRMQQICKTNPTDKLDNLNVIQVMDKQVLIVELIDELKMLTFI